MNKLIVHKEDDLKAIIQDYMTEWLHYPLWLLTGPLGVGKTTFVKVLVSELSEKFSNVRSPSYNIVHRYETPDYIVYHADFYRLEKVDLDEFGFSEWLGMDNNLCIVEWPEKLTHIPSLPHIHFNFQFGKKNTRTITIQKCQSNCL